jgi:hypothetical protein
LPKTVITRGRAFLRGIRVTQFSAQKANGSPGRAPTKLEQRGSARRGMMKIGKRKIVIHEGSRADFLLRVSVVNILFHRNTHIL